MDNETNKIVISIEYNEIQKELIYFQFQLE